MSKCRCDLLWMCILFCIWGSIWTVWPVFNCVWFVNSADRFGWTVSTWTSICSFLDILDINCSSSYLGITMRPLLPFVWLICSVESPFAKSVGSLLQPATFTHISCLSRYWILFSFLWLWESETLHGIF